MRSLTKGKMLLVSMREKWEREAERWTAWARAPGLDSYWIFHREAFFRLVPPPGRLTVDIGCGEGRVARDLKRLGHPVVAIDGSPTMVRQALEADPEGDYRVADAAALPLEDACADLALAFMSFQDVDDLAGAIAEAARILEPGGRLVFAIVHPLNSAGTFAGEEPDSPFVVTGTYLEAFPYSDELERDGFAMSFHSEHRPLEAYSRALEATGLLVEAIREPTMPDHAIQRESARRWLRVPLFLHLRAVKS